MNLQLPLDGAPSEQPLSVAAVVGAAREVVTAAFRSLWVEGEVGNLKTYPSGLWYFSLRDRDAQLRCVVFRTEARRLRTMLERLEDGTQVFLRGDLSVGKRGELELLVRAMLPRPEGGFLQVQFERARTALEKDGLLDPARRRPLPPFPRRIAVITSPEGAVWHDIVTTVAARWPHVELILVGSRVQGDDAPADLRRALAVAARIPELDVIILARGGGSREDLWPFNDEQVARAVAGAPVPTISAVGHETDVTLTDLVADLRAPTPTGAAQLAVPDQADVARRLAALEAAIARGASRRVEGAGHRVAQSATRIDRAVGLRLARLERTLADAVRRMGTSGGSLLERRRAALERHAASLEALSPLKVLGRGYSVARDDEGRVLRRVADFPAGARFRLRVTDGEVSASAGDQS